MQCVLAVRETVVIKKSRLNIVTQCLSNSLPVPSLSSYTHLSLKEDRSRSGDAEKARTEKARTENAAPKCRGGNGENGKFGK